MSGANQKDSLTHDDLVHAIDDMRAKYRVEREKRLRPEGNDQYIRIPREGELTHFVEDPFVKERLEREPQQGEAEVLIVGGGFGSLLTAARLHEVGITDICVVDDGADFGGTWYWNRYPGAQCDIESYVYMPLLEELSKMPSEKYAFAKELFEHCQAIGRHYGLYEKALFQTRVTTTTWNEETRRWSVCTDRGDVIEARFVVVATGVLTQPKLPGIPGIETFRGHMFHTCRWDYDYTGGSPDGNLTGLADKRVAVIGTGATAVQVVPNIAPSTAHLYVCQRTPSTIDVRGNRPTDEAWFKSLEPGWQRKRIENFSAVLAGVMQEEDLVADGWTDLMRKIIAAYREQQRGESTAGIEPTQLANFNKMNEIRGRVDELVEDPATAEDLKPYYDMFCKRPCFHDEFLQTFNRDNVTLVDTDGRGVERITETGFVVAGTEYPADCLIFATGFDLAADLDRLVGFTVNGLDGIALSERWADHPKTLHGIHAPDFPNMFFYKILQSTMSFNVPHVLDEQAKVVAATLGQAKRHGFDRVEASAQGAAEWVSEISGKGSGIAVPGIEECTPGYYNNEGQARPGARYYRNYGGGPVRYFRLLEQWIETGDFEGLKFS